MIILDTDCLSLLDREKHLESSKLRQKLDELPTEEIFTTIISFEEQMRDWMAFISNAKTFEQEIFAYERLHRSLETYRNANVLDYNKNAAETHKTLKSQKIRIGTMDLKIASIAISTNSILISRNLKDFEQVPDLSVQDWTR